MRHQSDFLQICLRPKTLAAQTRLQSVIASGRSASEWLSKIHAATSKEKSLQCIFSAPLGRENEDFSILLPH